MAKMIKFTKMHGLGNDFVVIDGINQDFDPDYDVIYRWSDRHMGIGFDQLLLVETPTREGCDFKYRIFNCDGNEVEQCGNGARCFAKYVYDRGLIDKKEIKVQTKKGIITLIIQENELIKVDMGQPKFDFQNIPFIPNKKSKGKDELVQIVSIGAMALPVTCVNMGNPHAVIMVDDVDETPVSVWGKGVEYSEQFPERTNVEFVEVIDRNHIKVRVHERGVGETLACGSGACAAVVAGISLEVLDNEVTVSLSGGDLSVSWQKGENIIMEGPAEFVFDGVIEGVE